MIDLREPLWFWEAQGHLRILIHQHKPEYRGLDTDVLTGPQACQSGAVVREMRTAYRVVYGLYAVSHATTPCARPRNELHIPGAALHRGYVLRIQLLQGYQ